MDKRLMARHLVFTDLHEDIRALESALHKAENLGGFSDVWFLGDAIGHNSSKESDKSCLASLAKLQEIHAISIRGNWEGWLLSNKKNDNQNEEIKRNVDREWLKKRHKLLKENGFLNYIKSWPWQRQKGDFTMIHGSPYAFNSNGKKTASWETYMWYWMTSYVEKIFSENHIQTKHMLFGHTHQPGYFHYNGQDAKWEPILENQFDQPIAIHDYPEIRYAINPGSLVEGRNSSGGTALLLDESKKELIYFKIEP